MSQEIQDLTLFISKLKDEVSQMASVYQRYPGLIEQEHEAIKKSDLDAVEDIAAKKVALGSEIETCFENIREHCRLFALSIVEGGSDVAINISTLSDVFPHVETQLDKFREEKLNVAVIEHVYGSLKDALIDFVSARDSARHLLEVNKRVLSKMLFNRQENYRFWQEVAADMMSSYNERGRQKAKDRRSTVNIKA